MKEKAACETVVPAKGPSGVIARQYFVACPWGEGQGLTIKVWVLLNRFVETKRPEIGKDANIIIRCRRIRLKVEELRVHQPRDSKSVESQDDVTCLNCGTTSSTLEPYWCRSARMGELSVS